MTVAAAAITPKGMCFASHCAQRCRVKAVKNTAAAHCRQTVFSVANNKIGIIATGDLEYRGGFYKGATLDSPVQEPDIKAVIHGTYNYNPIREEVVKFFPVKNAIAQFESNTPAAGESFEDAVKRFSDVLRGKYSRGLGRSGYRESSRNPFRMIVGGFSDSNISSFAFYEMDIRGKYKLITPNTRRGSTFGYVTIGRTSAVKGSLDSVNWSSVHSPLFQLRRAVRDCSFCLFGVEPAIGSFSLGPKGGSSLKVMSGDFNVTDYCK